MAAPNPVSAALERLQRSLRDESFDVSPADVVLNFAVPEDLAGPEAETLFLGEVEAADFREAVAAIAGDLRFEYMTMRVAGDPLRDALIRFACLCEMKRDLDQVSPFVSEHSRTPEERTCFIGVEYLRVLECGSEVGGRQVNSNSAPRCLRHPECFHQLLMEPAEVCHELHVLVELAGELELGHALGPGALQTQIVADEEAVGHERMQAIALLAIDLQGHGRPSRVSSVSISSRQTSRARSK